MNQFKDVFTGSRKVSYSRATTSQKCIRAGGKHNDLENVGQTNRHHTFFEMLGNFSFGDYFKEEAIVFAWDWVTKTLELSKDRLYATVYETDDDAFALWEKIAPELKNGRILRFGKNDNYWSMGNVGPCGPCSEIHYDMGDHLTKDDPKAWINTENDRYVEFWNLVFMQYDQPADGGDKVPLPKPSVDTGAGLERIAAIMQGVSSNYETDLFTPLTAQVAAITGIKYDTKKAQCASHRVIADHVRALSFALADGGGLSNEGRSYVLRRILRRAARHGRLLGYHEPIIYQLVPTLIDIMGGYFTELKEKQNHIEAVIKSEEERFSDLLDNGLELFSQLEKKVKSSGSDTIPGEDIFKLYDTYGFPVDMTAIMASESGLKMDMDGFEKNMNQRQEQSRAGSDFSSKKFISTHLLEARIDAYWENEKTEFVRETNTETVIEVKTKVIDSQIPALRDEVAIALYETPFYVEAGGQTGDMGIIKGDDFCITILKVRQYKDIIIHRGNITKGHKEIIEHGTNVTARIDKRRRKDIMRNHTATHLLHAALRKVLGDHVKQSGSLVEPERLRFDFSHFHAMTSGEVLHVEKIVNEQILEATPVATEIKSVDEAMKSGAMALFGEKYGDEVRIVSVGDFSKELCGGTHVSNTSEIGSFMITEETAIASGVRRIEAVTGRGSRDLFLKHKEIVFNLDSLLSTHSDKVVDSVQKILDDYKSKQKEIKKLKAERFSGSGDQPVGQTEKIGDVEFSHHDFGETDQDSMAGYVDRIKPLSISSINASIGTINGKSTIMMSGSAGAIEQGYDITYLFVSTANPLGGKGGGKSNFARGGLPNDDLKDKWIEKVREEIEKKEKVK